jgi:hypothetical protein
LRLASRFCRLTCQGEIRVGFLPPFATFIRHRQISSNLP